MPPSTVPARIGIAPLSAVSTLNYLVGAIALTCGATVHLQGKNPSWVLALLAVTAYACAGYALVRGRRFTHIEATVLLGVELVAVAVMSHTTQVDLAALGDGFGLPVLGAYAGWLLQWQGSVTFYAGASLWLAALVGRQDGYLSVVACLLALETAVTTEVVRALRRRVRRLTDVDALTGTLNRRALEDAADALWARAGRHGTPVTVALIDLDDLRSINNTSGHLAGDAMLIEAVRQWEATLPDSAVLGRVGGDEFVVLFEGVGEAPVRLILAAMRERCSIAWTAGVAECGPGEGLTAVMARADEDMYRHKADKRLHPARDA
jgi:diguanylate cyclase (GGDEF)-like protein